MDRETKSPIKNLPVRLPGQSLDDQIHDIGYDKVLYPAILGAVFCVMAFLEWVRVWLNSKPAPWLYTAVALLAVAWAIWKIRPFVRQIRNLRLGRTGERAVGQYLEEALRPLKYHVLHDIPGDRFNLDHVVVGPTGVFSVETKTHSKPVKGSPTVKYDGNHITVDGLAPDRDPVVQAKAQSRWLHELIESSTGKRFPVQPIVLYPGWYVDKMPEHAEVWVLNEKAAPVFIQNHKAAISPEDVTLIVFHLKRFVIAGEQGK